MRRKARASLALLLGAIGACNGSPDVQTRKVTLHAPAACAPDPASASAVFEPLGDFQPQGSLASVHLAQTGTVLAGFPSDTAEVVASVIDEADTLEWAAHGVLGATAGSGDVDLLALPLGSPCALTDTVPPRTAFAFGAIDEGHALIAGGSSTSGVPATELVDLTRGTVSALPLGLLVPRTNPTVTAWSGGSIVAGGVQFDGSASFEVYSTSAGDFDGATYPLSQARARHGAAVMANGDTLLVGGVDPSEDVLGSMEAIDPVARRAITGGLGALQVPRADPVVLRLASGEILVAGGVDGTGQPVSTLEWFQADGSASTKATQDLVSAPSEAFVALPAGGALAVIAPPSPPAGFQNVWVISAAGALQPATSIQGALTAPVLLAGTQQEPLLWTGDRWLVWQPWQGSFTSYTPAIGAAGPSTPATSPQPTTSPEPGLGAWCDGAIVHALRFGTRGPYAATPTASPFFVTDTTNTAPDELVTGGGASGPIAFANGALTLEPGASVFVTDATFGAFALDAQTPGSAPPAIVLRDAAGNETLVDSSTCGGAAAGTALHVESAGGVVRMAVNGGAPATCSVAPAAGARVAIGVRGEGAGSAVAALTITRM